MPSSSSTSRKNPGTMMELFARSVGFVDNVCCYSYTNEQLHREENDEVDMEFDISSIKMSQSFDMGDDDDAVYEDEYRIYDQYRRECEAEQQDENEDSPRSSPSSSSSSRSKHHQQLHQLPLLCVKGDDRQSQNNHPKDIILNKENLTQRFPQSPGRSTGTATTVTTSTTTTVVTSSRPAQDKLNQSLNASFEQIQRRHSQQRDQSLKNKRSEHVKIKPRVIQLGRESSKRTNRLPSFPFRSATEGYQC